MQPNNSETAARPSLALPRPCGTRDRRYTVHLDAAGEAALLRIAHSRGERPGRVATLLVETGAAMLDPGEVAGFVAGQLAAEWEYRNGK